VASPTFCVAGAARSGTTAVIEGLRSHPDVFVTSPKEPHYFAFAGEEIDFQGPGDAETINRVAVTDRRKYLELYADTDRFVARGDGSVSTLYYYDRAIEAIKTLNPDLRIALILRNPVERAHSSYQYLRSRGYEQVTEFEKALDAEKSRRDSNWHHLWHYVAMSRYADQVEAFLSAFGDSQVGIWTYESLTADYDAVIASINEFVGVAPQRRTAEGQAKVNVSGRPRFAALQHAQLWMTRQQWVRSAVKAVVPFSVRERIRGSLLTAESVSPQARERLTEVLADDVARLRHITGRSFVEWSL
jgi:hypothetical protein